MNKITILLAVLYSWVLFSQTETISIPGLYTVEYSEELEQPLWLEYTAVKKEKIITRKKAGYPNFKKRLDYDIKTADNDDYYKNVWDKGHLAPANHFSYNLELYKKTFDWVNCALQHEVLNQNAIRDLEEYVWNLPYNVKVRIRLVFSDKNKVEGGAVIPTAFWYRIEYSKYVELYWFNNVADEDFKDNRLFKRRVFDII